MQINFAEALYSDSEIELLTDALLVGSIGFIAALIFLHAFFKKFQVRGLKRALIAWVVILVAVCGPAFYVIVSAQSSSF